MGARAVVFVVDDDEDIRGAIEDVLSLDGHAVIGFQNGEQAISALAVTTPDLVVTDLAMPVLDGVALIRKIRSSDRTRQIPVCVVSADVARIPDGVVAVKKPFEVAQLRETVRVALGMSASTSWA